MIGWKELHGGITVANIGQVVRLTVTWNSDGYRVQATGGVAKVRHKLTIKDYEQAKAEAIRLGLKMLDEAMAEIQQAIAENELV